MTYDCFFVLVMTKVTYHLFHSQYLKQHMPRSTYTRSSRKVRCKVQPKGRDNEGGTSIDETKDWDGRPFITPFGLFLRMWEDMKVKETKDMVPIMAWLEHYMEGATEFANKRPCLFNSGEFASNSIYGRYLRLRNLAKSKRKILMSMLCLMNEFLSGKV